MKFTSIIFVFLVGISNTLAGVTPDSCQIIYDNAKAGKNCSEFDSTSLLACSKMYYQRGDTLGITMGKEFFDKAAELMSNSAINLATSPIPFSSDYCVNAEQDLYLGELANCSKLDMLNAKAEAAIKTAIEEHGHKLAEQFVLIRLPVPNSYKCLSDVDSNKLKNEISCMARIAGGDPAVVTEGGTAFFTEIGNNCLNRPVPEDHKVRCGEYLDCIKNLSQESLVEDSVLNLLDGKYDEVRKTCTPKYTVMMTYSSIMVKAQVKWEKTEINFAETKDEINLVDITDIPSGGKMPRFEIPLRVVRNGQPMPYSDIVVAHSNDDSDTPKVNYMNAVVSGTWKECWPVQDEGSLNTLFLSQKIASEHPIVDVELSFDMACGIKGEGSMPMSISADAYGDGILDAMGRTFLYPHLKPDVVLKLQDHKDASIKLTNKRTSGLKSNLVIDFLFEGY